MRHIERIDRRRGQVGLLVACVALVIGAGTAGAQSGEWSPTVEPADFSTMIDNPLFPLQPGTR
jgi:hypothetical protein